MYRPELQNALFLLTNWIPLLVDVSRYALAYPPFATRESSMIQGYKSLNRIQSIVFNTAYKTNENMLVSGQCHHYTPVGRY